LDEFLLWRTGWKTTFDFTERINRIINLCNLKECSCFIEVKTGIGHFFGYMFESPEPVYLTVGVSLYEETRDYHYYNITCIEKRY